MSQQAEQVQVTIKQADAVKRYGVSDRTLRQWVQDGKLAVKHCGRLAMYSVKQLDELLVPVQSQ